jgi:hypothetical protein
MIDEKSPRQGSSSPYQSFKMDLDKGKLYKIEVESKDFTPTLLIYKDKGDLAAGDKSADKMARLYFIPPATGSYDVRALIQLPLAAKKGETTPYGAFTLTVQPYEVKK